MASVAAAYFTPDQRTPVRRTSAARGKRYSNTSVSKRKAIKTWRVTVLPGLIMFLCTLGLIFLSIFLLFLLISQGMFKRQVVTVNAQLADTYFWTPYGQSCVLTSAGFTPNSCDADTTSIIPNKPFTVVGSELAKQWAAELTQAGGLLYVTTCIIGGTSNVGWTNLQFIAGYDYFPECLPTEPQDVAGMAMLETTIRDTHVDGLYFLTLLFDTLVGLLRSFSSCVGYSAPIFTAVCIVWMTQVWCHDAFFLDVYNKFFSAPAFLGFYVNNASWPSGSYVAEGTPPVVTYLAETIVTAGGGSFGIAIAISSIYRRIRHKKWLVSTVWCRSNSVLSALHLPNCITALPLDPSNGIKMGNKMYCKPSTIAIMGYTAVVERQKWGKDKRDANQLPSQLISIYALLPVMVVPSWVSSFGTVDHNHFTPTPATRLAQAKRFMHTRGSCVV
ncbi:hypothetical protein H257_00072 [Aphanomyces astaci]|uniref:Uncharacterized protein n=1 Tax=Aphanomyces astaci TaxID=112090 RepID=W4HBJ3_APHAT|nr:hypothetical protein H257_00072 [Aphanomyces astaci]ETV88488.1 hypothetical protein H257_00072 [Aphanomyces astaci]|eukprot:XP_009820888.1 hypothetical protein H257_00072 [Aphanomyces astaci]